jgi:hypothetical protein
MKIKRENFYKYKKSLDSSFFTDDKNFLITDSKSIHKNNMFSVKGIRNEKSILKVSSLSFQLRKLRKVLHHIIVKKLKKILIITNDKHHLIIKKELRNKESFLVASSKNLNYYNSKSIMKAKGIAVILFILPNRKELELLGDGLRQKKLIFGLINNKLNSNFFDYSILINSESSKAETFFILFIKRLSKW